MTVVTEPAASAPPGAGEAPRRTKDRTARGGRRLVLAGAVVGAVVLAVLVGTLLTPATTRGDLEPTSAAPQGARAVARILEREGVDVTTVRRSTDVEAAATAGTTVLVTFPDRLGPEQLRRVAGTPARLVLIAPDLTTLRALAPFATNAGTAQARTAAPACTLPAAAAAGDARAGGNLYRLGSGAGSGAGTGAGPGAVLCYPAAGDPSRGSLVVGRVRGREVVVLGQPDVLRNEHLAAAGDAALALRLLGAQDRLVWYLPDPAEVSTATEPATLRDVLPPWVPWVGVQLVLVALLMMLWQGRRLGALVHEPLPVVVRAAETEEGRARLYRRARAHGRAAATLRTAALRRLARRLDVPPDATPDVVAALAAEAAGLPPAAVHATFLDPPPRDDRGLVRLADEIAAVERAVAAPPAGPARASRSSTSPDPTSPHRKASR